MSTISVNPDNIFLVKNYTTIRTSWCEKEIHTVGLFHNGDIYVLPNAVESDEYNIPPSKQKFDPYDQLELVKNNPEIKLNKWRILSPEDKAHSQIPLNILEQTSHFKYMKLKETFDAKRFNNLKMPLNISIPYLMVYGKTINIELIPNIVCIAVKEGRSQIYVNGVGSYSIDEGIGFLNRGPEGSGTWNQKITTEHLIDLISELNEEYSVEKFILSHGKDPFWFSPISKYLSDDQLFIIESFLFAICL